MGQIPLLCSSHSETLALEVAKNWNHLWFCWTTRKTLACSYWSTRIRSDCDTENIENSIEVKTICTWTFDDMVRNEDKVLKNIHNTVEILIGPYYHIFGCQLFNRNHCVLPQMVFSKRFSGLHVKNAWSFLLMESYQRAIKTCIPKSSNWENMKASPCHESCGDQEIKEDLPGRNLWSEGHDQDGWRWDFPQHTNPT